MLPLILVLGTAQADIPLGTPINDAVAVDLTTQGLDSLLTIATGLIPSRIDVEDIGDQECAVPEVFSFCALSYEYQVNGVWVEVELDNLQLVPGPNNTLVLDGIATVRVNEPADPIDVYVEGEVLGAGISDSCDVYVRDFQVQLSATVGADLVVLPATGEKVIDFTVGTPTWSWTLTENDIEVTGSGCDLDTINDITSFFGYDLIEILIDQVEPEIDALITDLPALVEPTLDEALPSLSFTETFDLLGVPLDIQVEPDQLLIDSGGLRISLLSKIEAPVAECVEPFLVDMVDTPSSLPPIGQAASSVTFTPDAIAQIDDDFVNQALYAVWAGGVLCIDDDLDLGLPVPLSSLLGGLLPADQYNDIFDLDTLEVAITPTQPPRFSPQGPADVNLALDGIGIGFNGQLEGRKVRIANVNLAMDLSTDIDFDGNTGELAVAIDLLGADITSEVDFNEYLPEATPDIEEGVPATIQSLFPFVAPLLDDLVFPLPSFEGAGITVIEVEPAGAKGDWLGVYAGVGPVPYQSKGCEDGCSGTGCSTGDGGIALFTFPLMVVFLRRRRSA